MSTPQLFNNESYNIAKVQSLKIYYNSRAAINDPFNRQKKLFFSSKAEPIVVTLVLHKEIYHLTRQSIIMCRTINNFISKFLL